MERALNMEERLLVRGFLYTLGGDYPTLVLIESTINAIMSEAEMERLGVMQEGSMVTWNTEAPDQIITATFGDEVLQVIVTALNKLNEAGKLDFSLKPLYEMFVLEHLPTQ